jgi:hypothetical protein
VAVFAVVRIMGIGLTFGDVGLEDGPHGGEVVFGSGSDLDIVHCVAYSM